MQVVSERSWSEVDSDFICEPESCINTPDKMLWFMVLNDAIMQFLEGSQNEEVEQWILGNQRLQYSFDEVWQMFFDIDPEYARTAMMKRRNGNGDSKNKTSNHGRRRRAKSCRDNSGRRSNKLSGDDIRIEDWIEFLFFG